MNQFLQRKKSYFKTINFRKIIKTIGFLFLGIVAFLVIASAVLSVYFKNNKAEIVTKINAKINENITGTIDIGDIKYKFLKGFPNMTLALSQVELKDSLWSLHKRTLLKAEQIEVRVDVLKLLSNEINIDKIEIQQATLYLFKGKNGIVNTNIFRPKPKSKKSKSSTDSKVKEIVLDQVHFISENQMGHKLFDFNIVALRSQIDHENENWQTNLYLKTLAKSMAFNTKRGSFIQNRMVEGVLKVGFSNAKNQISVATTNFGIGSEFFDINAHFSLDQNKSPFDIAIKTTILWRDASALLSANIREKIDQFDLKNPIDVGCTIIGDMNATGDPEIVVTTKIKNNELKIPDGIITDCTFDATFTNQYKKGAGYNDINSTITLTDFSGKYKTIPFAIPIGIISNFEKTTAAGSFKSDFNMSRLNEIVNKDFIHFSDGQAKVNLEFKFDILDLKIQKPLFTGNVDVKNATVNYGPRNLTFVKTDIELDFTEEALLIKKINFKDRKNKVFMEGKIDNFLTLYYENPEKMIVNWDIYAPFLDIKQFVGIITSSGQKASKKKNTKDDFSSELYVVIDKCQVVLNLKADNMVYSKLEATNAKATVLLVNNQLIVKNGWVQSSGGSIAFDGELVPEGDNFLLKSNTKINRVDISRFLTSLNNFGIQSFQPNNIKGLLSASTSVQGTLLSGGELKTNSIAGRAKFKVDQGALTDFKPITNIGKFAFPFRNVNHIVFSDLSGNFKINGGLVDVNDLKISSNVLNLDVNGIYSFGRGTNLAMTIPLRNPKNDEQITDEVEKAEKRTKGIVLHLLAVDVDGKIKIRWNKDHEKL
ncbi:AsmA-like C-terminal region-containing protein [Flavobacterium sandaracinum]|uniref:AsmA family protein n=1 Tax=Flavobacterium sandaracinum TaxID=2541733 RepID=A0A4R5D0Y0_9FLAO|nr:AsmA-like C-terminal region-containing protein [Flavobacterium sandaracinum]TDE05897.1 AsmA family protein [Flavobacterium sandaracinum]